jgi:hypothetical protein
MRDGMERTEHIAPLPPAGRFDPTPSEAPKIPQKRAEDNMRRLYKKDGSLTRLGFG